METVYLGIDPGRSKTGLALVNHKQNILALHIASTENFAVEMQAFVGVQKLQAVIMGNGTNSETLAKIVRNVWPDLALHFVGEAHSTEEARTLYWKENPPKGFKKLIPLGLQVPPVPLDAYAAVVQVRRWLAQNE